MTDALVGGAIVTVVENEKIAKAVVAKYGIRPEDNSNDNLTDAQIEIRRKRQEEEREIVFHGGASRLKDRILKKRKEVLGMKEEGVVEHKNHRAPLILKCDIAGQLEALEKAIKMIGGDVTTLLNKFSQKFSANSNSSNNNNNNNNNSYNSRDTIEDKTTHNLEIDIISSSLGQITNAEAVMAAESNALIICFGGAHTAGKVTPGEARKTIKSRDVNIVKSDVIYKILEEIKVKIGSEYLPKVKGEKILGIGKILKVFEINDGKAGEEDLVAGTKVISGKFVVNYGGNQNQSQNQNKEAMYRVVRNGKVVHEKLKGGASEASEL